MSITLNELLTLVGRLDDAPGFDAPRERFRRFLLEYVTDAQTARALIEECQRSVGEQHHRALQDLIVLLGRFLRFETTFGTYEPATGGVKVDGQWRSRGRLDVVLEIRTDQTREATLDSLARAMSAVAATAQGDVDARVGLCVVARHYAARGRLEHAMSAEKQGAEVRVVSVQSLLALAAQVSADRLSHGEVVKLLSSGFALDFVIDLLDRPAGNGRPSEPVEEPAHVVSVGHGEPAFWVAMMTGNEMATPEQLLASVVVNRRVLGICRAGPFEDEGSPGDWVCFFLPGKGIVGHAQLASVVADGASVVRQFERFSRVYRLASVELYEEPIVQALRAGRPFAAPPAEESLAGPCLAPIARQDFVALTAYRDVEPLGDTAIGGVTAWDFASERRSRSHG